jgi:hypothetical protein
MFGFHKSLRMDGRKLMAGELVLWTFPIALYKGVYVEGTEYEAGDMVSFGGSVWHCNEDTTDKPDGALKAWTLAVKRGRDGKDLELNGRR